MELCSAGRPEVSGQPIELRTPWSNVNPADRSRVMEKLKQRKPIVAYAPGVEPQKQSQGQRTKTFHKVGGGAPPLPPTKISLPGVHVARTQDAPRNVHQKDQAPKNSATAHTASIQQEAPSSTGAKNTPATTAPSGSQPGASTSNGLMQLFQSRVGASVQSNKTLGSRESFGSPTSLGEAFNSKPQGVAVSAKPQGKHPEVQSSSTNFGAPSGGGSRDVDNVSAQTGQGSSMLGSPAMHRTTVTLSSPATVVQGTSQSLASRQALPADGLQLTQSPTRLFNAHAPSPFASGVPEGASDILPPGSPGAISFTNLGFGGNGQPAASTSPGTLAFGVPSPQQNTNQDTNTSATASSPFSPFGPTTSSVPQQTELSNTGLFAKFGEHARGQGTLFSGQAQLDPSPAFGSNQQSPTPVGAQAFGQTGSPALGGRFGAPAVLGAGGVAANLGSLQVPSGSGYAGMSGGGNAFANLAPPGAGSAYGNQAGGGFTSFASGASAFGALASANNTFGGNFGGPGGQPLLGGSGMQSGPQEKSQLWQPRR